MRVVRGLWRLLVGIKDALVLLLLLLFFGTLYAALSARPNPSLPSGPGALLIRLSGTLVEQPADADPLTLLSGNSGITRETRLRDVVRALRFASADPQVKAVVLDLDSFVGGGQATIAAAGEAVDGVRRAGKPVLAYATGYLDDSFQLAAHASEIWLNPMGAVLVSGPGGQGLYMKGLFDKLGVSYNVYRVGTFKSAVEPFIRSSASPEARAADQALADSLFAAWNDEVAKARPRARIAAYARDPVAALTAAGGDSAAAAARAGLVDRLGDRNALARRIAEITGKSDNARPDAFRAFPLDRYLAARPEGDGGRVGVLTVAGAIVDGNGGPGAAASETIARVLGDELARKRIKALVVRIDSPGGSVTASERIRGMILEARRQNIPVIVSMGSVAASGGYWIATSGETIFAEPSTITGSIGVFGLLPTFRGTLEKIGVAADGVGTTPLSGQPDLYHGPNQTFDRLMQSGVESVYRRFIGLVAKARGKTPAEIDRIGQGRVWAGGTARQLGLVDRFGGLDDAIAYAAQRAGLTGTDARPRWIERSPSSWKGWLRDLALGPDQAGSEGLDPWTRRARLPEAQLVTALATLREVGGGPAIQIRCLECAIASGRAGDATERLAVRVQGLLARMIM